MSIHRLPTPQQAPAIAAADDCNCEPATAPAANDSGINVHLGVADIATVNADIGTGSHLASIDADVGTGGGLATLNADIGTGGHLAAIDADVGTGGDLLTVNADIGTGGHLAAINANIGTGGDLATVHADLGSDDYSGIGLKVAALADAGLLDVSAGADFGADTDVNVGANVDLPLDCIGAVPGDLLSIHLPELGMLDHATC